MAKRVSTPPAEAELALLRVKEELLEKKVFLADVAKGLGITRQAVSGWHAIPAEWVKKISELTGIPPHRLRPDLYDEPRSPKRRSATVG
jgi:Bacterial toxin YdaS